MAFNYRPIPFDDPVPVNTLRPGLDITTSIDEIAARLAGELPGGLTLLDGFPTAVLGELVGRLACRAPGLRTIDAASLYLREEELREIVDPYLPPDRDTDPELIFGRLFDEPAEALFDRQRVSDLLGTLAPQTPVLLYGFGSSCSLFRPHARAIVYADVTPKDTALRIHDRRYACIGNPAETDLDIIVRQAFFIDIEMAVRLRKELIGHRLVDFYVLDSEQSVSMLRRDALEEAFDQLRDRPLRAKPVYVEGVWGGQFIKRLRGIPEGMVDKIAWAFELIPTEASLLLASGDRQIDVPFMTVMDAIGQDILGDVLNDHFDGRFPVRFNYDDTWHSNGNMSIQVHPSDEMIRRIHGDIAAQNESYYIVLTGHGAKTYCGFKDDGREFLQLCRASEQDGSVVPYEQYINALTSEVGRQIFLPHGTIHSSGRNQLVLEQGTVTTGAYTYKIYDYGRPDITGNPRPIHTKLAAEALAFDRDAAWVDNNIAFPARLVANDPGWTDYLVGQYDGMYFETHRIEIDAGQTYPAQNLNGFCVLTLVDGEAATIQARNDPDRRYDAAYLDVVLVPASIREFEVIATAKQPIVVHKTVIREDRYQAWQRS